jgi:hypothetical protein
VSTYRGGQIRLSVCKIISSATKRISIKFRNGPQKIFEGVEVEFYQSTIRPAPNF